MSEIKENRRVSYSSNEVSCRYLGINLPLSLRSPSYTGKFGKQLREIGIEKFPFGITLSDLVLCGAVKPSLFVTLPREYFDEWINFPECPRKSRNDDHAFVGMFSCQPLPQRANDLNDLLHPYDGELKVTFSEKYRASVPESFLVCNHSSGGKYIAAEAYLPYWQIYALAGNFHKYRHAESFLSPEAGRGGCLQLIKSASVAFVKKYGNAFDRVSWYKTIAAGANFCHMNVTNGQLLDLTQKHTSINVDLLKKDLRLLLELDAEWHSTLEKNGCTVLEKSRSSLSKDIYLVYEQLRLLDVPASIIFEDFTPDHFEASYTPLHDVLQSEGYGFKKSFISFGTYYCSEIHQWGYDCTEEVFDSLIQVLGFDAWIRAFHDLHQSINKQTKHPVSFKQKRIVDALIVMAVRTEIVLREMFRSALNATSDASIVDFLKAIKIYVADEKQKIIGEALSKSNSESTKLHQRPEELFCKIEKIAFNKWSKEDIFSLHVLLKFILARNYFAHHAYKDLDLNIQTSEVAKEILESLLATLLFFEKNKKKEMGHAGADERHH